MNYGFSPTNLLLLSINIFTNLPVQIYSFKVIFLKHDIASAELTASIHSPKAHILQLHSVPYTSPFLALQVRDLFATKICNMIYKKTHCLLYFLNDFEQKSLELRHLTCHSNPQILHPDQTLPFLPFLFSFKDYFKTYQSFAPLTSSNRNIFNPH